jgi:hypothetical protein
MQMISTSALVMTVVFAAILCGVEALAATNAKPLSAILKDVADAGYSAVTEASYGNGRWFVEARKNGKPVDLKVDPLTGKVLGESSAPSHQSLPAKAKTLAAIIKLLEKKGYSPVKQAELKLPGWKVKALHHAGWRELVVGVDGKILADLPEKDSNDE